MGFDSKRDFAPPTILLGLLLCPWMWDIFLVGCNILLLMVVQWLVAILEFSQKMRTLLCHLSKDMLSKAPFPVIGPGNIFKEIITHRRNLHTVLVVHSYVTVTPNVVA